MRKILTLLLLLVSIRAIAQTNPITTINITLPANPDALTANWGSGNSLLVITASAPSATGRVDAAVMESKILVIIKKGGNKICGAYTGSTAPAAGFNAITKVWTGSSAVSLLGQDCTLPPGDYTLSVQFFGYSPGKAIALSDEKIKPFTIKGNDQQAYQPPTNLSPANPTVFKQEDIKKPITFRWTPVVPRPKDPVTYHLKVWQLMQGQTGVQAMRANQPIITKDVDNITQAIITNIIDGPCKSPYLCSFIWTVQAVGKDGKPIGSNNGISEPFQFSANTCDVKLTLKLNSVECLPANDRNNHYKVCIAATYSSAVYALTYANGGSGIKAYAPSYTPAYAISNLSPALQVQNTGGATTVNYCFEVSVPAGQTAMKVGLQGDDKNPGPISCQPGAELDVKLPACVTCGCGNWGTLVVNRTIKYECGPKVVIPWKCNQAFNFADTYQCSTANCQAVTSWDVKLGNTVIRSGTGNLSGSFTPTGNGTYTVTLYASCNGSKCTPCTYYVSVNDCITCDCGKWSGLTVRNAAGTKKYDCGSSIQWSCKQPFAFTDTYQCSSANCRTTTSWSIKKGDVNIASGSGTGNVGSTFTPTANGTYTITLNASCDGKPCPPCTCTIKVDDCVTCDCGKWSGFIVGVAPGSRKYDCGSTIPWKCANPFTFTDSYQCSTDNCKPKTSWTIKKDGAIISSGSGAGTISSAFTPTANGTYIITLNATCDGKPCPPCISKVTVSDCVTCDCGKWSGLTVRNAAGTKKYDCGSSIQWSCKQPFTFTDTYQCSSANCRTITSWSIKKGDAAIASGSGVGSISGTFTPTTNGVHTITLNANCNGKPCPPCSYKVTVNNCITCDCGKWSVLAIIKAPCTNKFDCGSTIPWTCKQAFNFSDTYQCSTANCRAVTSWVVKNGNTIITSGSGVNSIYGTFTPPASGTYTITLNASCDGKPCPPCTYTVTVNCPLLCDCGKWSGLKVQNAAGTKIYSCGSTIPWTCKQAFTFTDSYQCSTVNCHATTSWAVKNGNVTVASGNGAGSIGGAFTPIANGVYTITLNASCNDKACPPCTYTVTVNNCCVTPPTGMVGWWPGDSNANDITSFGSNGTLHGSTGYTTGKVANAFQFVGYNDAVSIANSAHLNFGTGDFSMDAWVKVTSTNGILNIVDKRTGAASAPVGYSFFISNGNLSFQLGDGQPTLNRVSATAVGDGKWHLVAATIDRKNKNGGKLYVDGVAVFTFDPTSRAGSVTTTAELYIGQRNISSWTQFNGLIDEVELFNRVVTPAEVSSLYNAGAVGKCKPRP